MQRDHKPSSSTAQDAKTPAAEPSHQAGDAGGGGAPIGTDAGKGASAGAWEADGGLTDAMGLTSGGGGGGGAAPTVFRDLMPGASADAAGGGAVDTALADAGKGEAHPSGATIHDDATAHAAASELGAAAFTAGSDIFFGAGQHDPGTEQGDALMRHELAHVEQTRGLAPPEPGNYKVSKPDDPAETAAAAAESGGDGGADAEAGTIHTKKTAAAATADADATDKLQEFFDALAAHNVAEAKRTWSEMKAADKARMRKAKVKSYPSGLKSDPIESIIEIMGKDGLPIMKETKAAFDKRSYSDAILDDKTHDAAYWMPALKGASLFDDWLGKLPKRGALGDSRLAKLDPWMTQAGTAGDAKRLWEHAYPKLKDKSYDPPWLKAAKWEEDDIKRMWKAIQSRLPLAHMQTISGGFNLGTHEKFTEKDSAGNYKWTELGFGWYHGGPNVVVMPKKSSTKSGGDTTHGMVGGEDAAGTKEDPHLTHFDSTLLHEIGHGVGDRTDGNTWAKKHGEWKDHQSWNAWSKHLFDDDEAKQALPKPAPKKVLAPADARQFLAKEVAGGSFVPAKWKRTDVVSFIQSHYGEQKLAKYWQNVKTGGKDAYEVDENNNAGSRTYVWLERGDQFYTSYKKEISDNKVSSYSLSSTVEWFAEQYSKYYQTGKSGAGLDAATKKKLDAIDKMEATKKGGLKKPRGEGQGAEAAGGADTGEAGGGPSRAPDDGSKGGGRAAAGDTSGEEFAAQIHRMNF